MIRWLWVGLEFIAKTWISRCDVIYLLKDPSNESEEKWFWADVFARGGCVQSDELSCLCLVSDRRCSKMCHDFFAGCRASPVRLPHRRAEYGVPAAGRRRELAARSWFCAQKTAGSVRAQQADGTQTVADSRASHRGKFKTLHLLLTLHVPSKTQWWTHF